MRCRFWPLDSRPGAVRRPGTTGSYQPQFQHKTGRLLGFTNPADGAESGFGNGGWTMKFLPFLSVTVPEEGRPTGCGMLRA
jgi:hypothetical protein